MIPGTAISIADFAVMFAYNPPMQVLIAAVGCIIVNIIGNFIGYATFKNFKIRTASQIRDEVQGNDLELTA